MGGHFQLLLFMVGVTTGLSHAPQQKGFYMSDYILQDVISRLNKDLSVAADKYLGLRDTPNRLRPNKIMQGLDNVEIIDPVDLEGLTNSRSPSLRDQEYIPHTNMWGPKYVAGGAGEGAQRLTPDGAMKNRQQVKSDTTLPAYCNPPNPCPVGYKVEGCIKKFENTAAFSRDYQRSQDCMCDSEHMFECSNPNYRNNRMHFRAMVANLPQLKLQPVIGKKYFIKKNPYLAGDRLPVAAKKGINLSAQ